MKPTLYDYPIFEEGEEDIAHMISYGNEVIFFPIKVAVSH